MYQALYRKYRPTNFEETVGQKVIIQTLKNSIITNRISHAYLFCGSRGTGKTTIAKIIAKTVNCLNPEDGMCCNKCENCIQFADKKTTDIIEIDAASNNGVDEIREIRNKVNLVPSTGKYKVYIIDEVHMLTVGAFNALLKTLEEPPSHVIFILATTEPHKIPMTILSRCQRFDFKKISEDQLYQRLQYISEKENILIEENALHEIAHLSDGGMRDAISMLDQASSYSNENITIEIINEINGTISKEEIKKILTSVFEKNINVVFQKINDYNDKGKNLVKFLEEIMIFLKNVLVYRNVQNFFDESEQENYNYSEKEIDSETIIYYIEEFNKTLNEMKLSNQPKLLLEVCLIKIMNQKKENIIETCDIQNPKSIEVKKTINTEMIRDHSTSINNKNEELNTIKMDSLKKLRIENTLAEFKKIYLVEAKQKINDVINYMTNPEYTEVAPLILDGNIRAASDQNMIFVFDNEWQSQKFNENILSIEKLLKEIYGKNYSVISTRLSEWEKIKNEFNSKKGKYVYHNEPEGILNFLKQNITKNEIEETFGDIIDYE